MPNQQFGGRPMGGGLPRQVLVNTHQPKDPGADDFGRPSWRDRAPSQSSNTLYNSETGGFDPVGDPNHYRDMPRRNSRTDSQGGVRPTSLLQRGMGRGEPGPENDMHFQHQRFPGRPDGDQPYSGPGTMESGRQRSASIRSVGMSDTSSTTRDSRQPPAANNIATAPGGGNTDLQPTRTSQGPLYVSPTMAGGDSRFSRTGPPGSQLPNGVDVPQEPGENPVEAQKRVMKDAREQARARRLAEEAAAEEEKKLRIQKKLAELDEKMKAEAKNKVVESGDGSTALGDNIPSPNDATDLVQGGPGEEMQSEQPERPPISDEPQSVKPYGNGEKFKSTAYHDRTEGNGVARGYNNSANGGPANGSGGPYDNSGRWGGRQSQQPQGYPPMPSPTLNNSVAATTSSHNSTGYSSHQQPQMAMRDSSSTINHHQSSQPHYSSRPSSSSHQFRGQNQYHNYAGNSNPTTNSHHFHSAPKTSSPSSKFSLPSTTGNTTNNNHQPPSNYPTSPPLSNSSPSHHYNSRPYERNQNHRNNLPPPPSSIDNPSHFTPPHQPDVKSPGAELPNNSQRDHDRYPPPFSQGSSNSPAPAESNSNNMPGTKFFPPYQVGKYMTISGVPIPEDKQDQYPDPISNEWKRGGVISSSPWAPLDEEPHVKRFSMFLTTEDKLGNPIRRKGMEVVSEAQKTFEVPPSVPPHMLKQKIPGSSLTYEQYYSHMVLAHPPKTKLDTAFEDAQAVLKGKPTSASQPAVESEGSKAVNVPPPAQAEKLASQRDIPDSAVEGEQKENKTPAALLPMESHGAKIQQKDTRPLTSAPHSDSKSFADVQQEILSLLPGSKSFSDTYGGVQISRSFEDRFVNPRTGQKMDPRKMTVEDLLLLKPNEYVKLPPDVKRRVDNQRRKMGLTSDPKLQVTSKPAFDGAEKGKPKVSIPKASVKVPPAAPPAAPPEPELPNTRPTEDDFNDMVFQQEFGSTPTVCLPPVTPTADGTRSKKNWKFNKRSPPEPEDVTSKTDLSLSLYDEKELTSVLVKLPNMANAVALDMPPRYLDSLRAQKPTQTYHSRGGQGQRRGGHQDGQSQFNHQNQRQSRTDSGPSRPRNSGNRRGGFGRGNNSSPQGIVNNQ
ncbi:hypothetical protein ABW19_dt0204295 [Dactylella cylindrospora]|nr:hypothetical protein ABW19_dt0204295 [Dactylella cylindrospora]